MANTNTYVQPGDVVEMIAPTGGVLAGIPKQIGQLLVVPAVTVAATVSFSGATRGVFNVTKVGSQAWTAGALVYWDETNDYFTTTASGNLLAGVALEAVADGAGDTSGVVLLNGSAKADEA